MSIVSETGAEPIPGYTLIERIGGGAYGDVWRAEAPGGMPKAIKFVHGFHTESRAVRELKALERIKQIRHPFLISIERFEISNGRLIIVSELADGSLKDRFLEYRDAGEVGFPRQALLDHLRDVADALDYINHAESLQHLDVKAENLLLVGGRLKLGDFGLVRNLTDDAAAVVDGMTPRYAAPEVFKGRPSRYSDQFSLAVVYAELLTGEPPFDAESPADVAVIHLLGTAPRLDGLSAGDRPAIQRALSRKPEERFPSCRALIDALVGGIVPSCANKPATAPVGKTSPRESHATGAERRFEARPTNAGKGDAPSSPAADPATVVATSGAEARPKLAPIGEASTVVFTAESDSRVSPSGPRATASIGRLPPVELPEVTWEPRPTLFVGIGGIARQVLQRFERRLSDRFPSSDAIAAWQILTIDTLDHAEQAEIQGGAANDNLDASLAAESADDNRSAPAALAVDDGDARAKHLRLRLRTTQEYREASPRILEWLSRRWLYNIPRVPRTCGWRPLGRLALTDHGPRVMERLRLAITEMLSPASLKQSSAAVGINFSGAPQIVLVAAIGGGTGSGMALDVAYALRKLAGELGIGEFLLRGLLLHATDSDAAAQDLARANAFALLTELAHFNRPGCGYPGEPALELPAFPSIVPTFDETFLVHLGDDLQQTELNDQLERMADHLFGATATRAGVALDVLRASGRSYGELTVRTLGLYAVDNLEYDAAAAFVDELCRATADRWLGVEPTEVAAAPRYTLQLGEQRPAAVVRKLVDQGLGAAANEQLKQNLREYFERCVFLPDGAERGSLIPAAREAIARLRAEIMGVRRRLAATARPDVEHRAATVGPLPLAGIRATVCAFLQERIAQMATDLAAELPAAYFRECRQEYPSDESLAASLTGLVGRLRIAAWSETRAALDQIDVSRMLLNMCGKSRAVRGADSGIAGRGGAEVGSRWRRGTVVCLAPDHADRPDLEKFFSRDLQEPAMIVANDDPRLTIFCERENMCLRDVAGSLMEFRRGYAEMAARLQTRIDITWAPLPVAWPRDT